MAAASRPILNTLPDASAPLAAVAAPPDAPLPPCLVVNPLSFRASRGLAEEAIALALARGAEVVTVESPAALAEAIDTVLARRQRKLMVLAGDGTVRAVVEQLAGLPEGAWLPDLLVLPGGRTNLIANDLTPGARALDLLRRALDPATAPAWDDRIAQRFTLCIEQAGSPARHGFWVGGAVVDGVIRRTHEHRARGEGALHTGPLSTAVALAALGSRAVVGRSGVTAPALRVKDSREGLLIDGRVSVLMATTLQHRKGLFDPYASRAADDMRLTAVSRDAPRFWRSLPRLLTGRFAPGMNTAHGYVSGSFERVEITGLAGYSLDGETYDTDPARPVVLKRGARLRLYAS